MGAAVERVKQVDVVAQADMAIPLPRICSTALVERGMARAVGLVVTVVKEESGELVALVEPFT
jgi:hypothetical protein